MVVQPKRVTVNLNKIVNNYWNSVALNGNPWAWSLFMVGIFFKSDHDQNQNGSLQMFILSQLHFAFTPILCSFSWALQRCKIVGSYGVTVLSYAGSTTWL
jgi:hypothetical protein